MFRDIIGELVLWSIIMIILLVIKGWSDGQEKK